MRIFTLGWEFPPFFAGGVGIVCYELTKALAERGLNIIYVMPRGPDSAQSVYVRLIVAEKLGPDSCLEIRYLDTALTAYTTAAHYQAQIGSHALNNAVAMQSTAALYGPDLFDEIVRYATHVGRLAQREDFDIIHAHDWTTFPAAIAAKKTTGKKLIAHMHITQYDMVGGSGDVHPQAVAIEREGLHAADAVISVSEFTKQRCISQYGIAPEKITVLHNAATPMQAGRMTAALRQKTTDKIVLFAGRVTLQKGPDYFVRAAKLALAQYPDITFVFAGTGDMLPRMIALSAELGISHKFIFAGFFNRAEAEQLFALADVFVMPSVSEPFGIVPLEAMQKGTPVIVSRQSGVAEILNHCLKVNFWDVEDLSEKILSVLHYRPLHDQLSANGLHEVVGLSWDRYAARLENFYQNLLTREES